MASLIRPTRPYPLPPNPDIVTKNGRPHVHIAGTGKAALYPLSRDRTKYLKPSAKWYAKYRDRSGRLLLKPLSPNKDAAKLMLAELLKRVENEKAGVRDVFADHGTAPLSAHLSDWMEVLAAGGNTADYVRLKVSRVQKLIESCRFVFLGDLSASAVEAALADMRENPRCGIQSSNHYLGAVKKFARWLVKDRRMADNPLAHLEGGNVRLDRRHDRRDLSEQELGRVFTAARAGDTFRKLSGPDRAMLYLTSVYTGLRASELASLTPESFALDARPTVTVAAAYSKRRREDAVPLHPDIVARLRPWLAG
jgi:hypothetical protein